MSEEESQLYPPMVFFSFSFFSNGLTKTKNQKPKKKKNQSEMDFFTLWNTLYNNTNQSYRLFFVFSTYSYYPLKRGYQKNIARPLFISFLPSRITTFLLSSLALNHFYRFEIFIS